MMQEKELRSAAWFGKKGKDGFIYRAWMKSQDIPDYEFKGKLVIGCSLKKNHEYFSFPKLGAIPVSSLVGACSTDYFYPERASHGCNH